MRSNIYIYVYVNEFVEMWYDLSCVFILITILAVERKQLHFDHPRCTNIYPIRVKLKIHRILLFRDIWCFCIYIYIYIYIYIVPAPRLVLLYMWHLSLEYAPFLGREWYPLYSAFNSSMIYALSIYNSTGNVIIVCIDITNFADWFTCQQ